MQRIKIPFGGLNARADATCWPSWPRSTPTASCHVTTRQDIQLHFIHIDDTPDLMRRLAAVGITTREACGNSVRNVTACPLAGVCHTEAFDVTPYANALIALPARPSRRAGLRPQVQDRVLRLRATRPAAWSTCTTSARIAATRMVGRQRAARLRALRRRRPRRRAAPGQAVRRVPARRGAAAAGPGDRAASSPGWARRRTATAPASSSSSRSSASTSSGGWCSRSAPRCPHDPRWTRLPRRRCRTIDETAAARQPRRCNGRRRARRLRRAGARPTSTAQRQAGYAVVTVTLPLGDITADQTARAGRHRAQVRRRHRPHDGRAEHRAALGAARPTCPALYDELEGDRPGRARRRHDRRRHRLPRHRHLQARHRLARAAWPASCARAWPPSRSSSTRRSATCASRSAAASTPAASTTSPTSASTATAATIGGYTVPHFQVVLGGQWRENARLLRPGDRRGAVASASPRSSTASPTATSPSASGGETLPGLHRSASARRSSRRCSTTCTTVPAARRRPGVLHRLGRPARVHDRRHGRRRVRRRGRLAAPTSAVEAPRARRSRPRSRSRTATSRAPTSWPTRRCSRRARALVRTEQPDVPRRPGRDRARVQGALLRHRALLRPLRQGHVRAAALRPPREPPATARGRGHRVLVEEAQLFIDAVHAFEIREAGAQSALV